MTTREHMLVRLPYIEADETPTEIHVTADVAPIEKGGVTWSHTEGQGTIASDVHKFRYTFKLPTNVTPNAYVAYNNGLLVIGLTKQVPDDVSKRHIIRLVAA